MADPKTFDLSQDHPVSVIELTRTAFIEVLQYLQPAAGSGLLAVINAWADVAPGVVAKTGANTSTVVTYPTLRQNLEDNGNYQTLTGAGEIAVASHITYLSATSGIFALTIEQGTYDGQEKIIILTDNVTTAEFVLAAGFLDWNTLRFKQGSRSATLRWVGGSVERWVMVGGNAEGA